MTELSEVVQRLRRKEGIRSIQRNTGIHRTVIRELADEAERQGWLDADRPPPDGPTIDAVWRAAEGPPKEHALEAYATEIEGYLKSGLSMQSIHGRIRGRHACDESTVRRFIHRRFPEATPIRPSMLRPREPGILEVDFGQLPPALDDAGSKHKSWVFSARLRFSRWAYREVVQDQRTGTFLRCVENAVVALGGVPEQVVPDNLKAAVVRASFEDPILNRSFQDLARHYGFRIAPCDPGAPRQKAGVENDMRFIQGSFLPGFLHDQRQMGRETPWRTDLVRGLAAWGTEQELRTIAGVGRTVIDLLAEERSHLHPLPSSRWTPIDWQEQTIRRDWHVSVHRGLYSVLHHLIGQVVQVAVSPHQVRIFHH